MIPAVEEKGKRRHPKLRRPTWDAAGVRALRRHLSLTQQELADELGTRQQTISEWERGMYRPRGAGVKAAGNSAAAGGRVGASLAQPAPAPGRHRHPPRRAAAGGLSRP